MPRYAAFLRGVSPMNAKMPEVKRAFEDAGFTDVRTLLSSGNVVFDARGSATGAIERKAEAAMQARLGRSFPVIVRAIDDLRALISRDPFQVFRLGADAKRIVTFLREPARANLPVSRGGARILKTEGTHAFTVYVPSSEGPVFMNLIEKTFGKDVTTRTWETVKKVAAS
jgi:uncharacterized protein (DUF1697 family)